MYIKKVEIKNIRSISEFTMEFPEGKEAGWHVLIGDNGSGKSTLIRAIALGLIGPDLANGLYGYQDWNAWIPWGKEYKPKVKLTLIRDKALDKPDNNNPLVFTSTVEISTNQAGDVIPAGTGVNQSAALYGRYAGSGWFSASYGPFRRLTGGNEEFNFLVGKRPRIAAHLSAFREDFALNHVNMLLKDFELDSRTNKLAASLLNYIVNFINSSGLLNHGAQVEKIDSKGLNIRDANGAIITLNEMSDGYRSILSMTLDLLLRLSDIFSPQRVFGSNTQTIDIPGVVVIDEIDAHLHPTWQTRIGQWFTKFFPNIQFIVTTHSPLICRGCLNSQGKLNGAIWKLPAPGSSAPGGLLDEDESNRLIFGNVLDAYGTGAFGAAVERTPVAQDMLLELARLDKLFTFGKITPEQDKLRLKLQKIFSTDVITDF